MVHHDAFLFYLLVILAQLHSDINQAHDDPTLHYLKVGGQRKNEIIIIYTNCKGIIIMHYA